MKNYNKPIYWVGILLLLQFLSSCNSEKVLHADFEDDAHNSFPNLNLPGDPVGDEIQWYGNRGEHLKVLSQVNARDETENWMSFEQITSDPNFYPGLLSFTPASTSIGNSLYTITWVGKIGGPAGASNLLDIKISITENASNHSGRVLAMVLKPQSFAHGDGSRRFGVYLSEGGSLSAEPIGIIRSGIPHSVIITISEEEREYTIAGIGHTITRSFSSDINLNRPSLSFIFDGFPGIGVYQFNYVGIHEGAR